MRKSTPAGRVACPTVTVLVDLTPLVDGSGPARLIDMQPGRSAQVLKSGPKPVRTGLSGRRRGRDGRVHWLRHRRDEFDLGRRGKSWTRSTSSTWPPTSSPGVGNACSAKTTGRRGRKNDPLYKHRRALLTRTDFLTERQRQRLELSRATDDDYVALQVTWGFYQELISAYGHPKKQEGLEVDEQGDQRVAQGTTEGTRGVGAVGSDVCVGGMTFWRSSTSARRTARSRPSMDGWSIFVASPWGSGTWTTTSCGQ